MLHPAPARKALSLLAVFASVTAAPAQGPSGALGQGSATPASGVQAPNPYRLKPYDAQFPVELDYPPKTGREYDRTRRQILQQLAKNLQGNVRKEAWQIATEFFWRAPEDAIDPLIEVMDEAMGNPALADVVRNCVEAMGKMALPDFDAALRRALQHKSQAVRQGAYSALASCGTDATLKALNADFVHMDGRGRQAWLGAVRKRLPSADRVAILKAVMMANHSGPVRDQVLKEAVQLPAIEAVEILKGRWSEAIDEFKAIIAGVLHAAGDRAGTAWLNEALESEDLDEMRYAIKHCMYGEDADAVIGGLRERLLRASTHLRTDIRLELVKQLTRVSGEDVEGVFEVLAAPDEVWEIRAIAVRELTRRGKTEIVTVLLEEVQTATGNRLESIINQLSVSGDPRAVPQLVGRFERCEDGEGRSILQAIAQNGSQAAAEALFEIFTGPVRRVSRSTNNTLTTRSYLPVLLLNVRGSEAAVLERYLALPKDANELRARMMSTVVGYAVDRRDQPELQKACVDPIRAILFDRSELPQLRVLALNLLARNWLTIDDILRLNRSRHKETPQMRVLFTDFLVDAF